MDKKYQIFVSSTFEDLKEERRKVIEQILYLGHIPVGMELFQAGDESQWDLIKRRIGECDYYVVIVAERYGAEGPGGKSYTRMEYEFSIKSKVPTIAFLLHNDARKHWPADRVQYSHKDQIQDFRKLCQKKIVQFWQNGDDLAAKVVTSLTQLMRDKPRIGWVHADQATSPNVLTEISKLSEEKRELQRAISELELDKKIKFSPTVIHLLNILLRQRLDEFIAIRLSEEKYNLPNDGTSMLELFMYLSRLFAEGSTMHRIERAISGFLSIPPRTRFSGQPFIAECLAKDLITIVNITEHVFDKPQVYKQYVLTDTGKSVIMCWEIQLENDGTSPYLYKE